MNDSIVSRVLNWLEIVQKSEGANWTKPVVAYRFTNRTFNDNHPVNWPPGDQYAEDFANDYADLN